MNVVNDSDRTGPLIKVPNHLAITSGKGVNGVWVGAVNHLVTGDLKLWAKIANVQSIRVPGYWSHRKGYSIKVGSAPQPEEKVVYHLHGGAYTLQSAHPKDFTAPVAMGFLDVVDPVTRVFAVEYRLASGNPFKSQHPFPTQLLDALAGYNYLVNVVKFAPENIIVVGDSAGGNLAYALIRYLTEYQDTTDSPLPGPPGALVLISPWMDLGMSHESLSNGSAKKFVSSDFLGGPDDGLPYSKNAFTGPHGMGAAETNPYISPASLHPGLIIDFKKFPRTFIVAGGAEVFYDAIKTFKNRMVADLGEGNGIRPNEGKIRYHEASDAVHGYLAFPWHEPERTDTLKEINKWVKQG